MRRRCSRGDEGEFEGERRDHCPTHLTRISCYSAAAEAPDVAAISDLVKKIAYNALPDATFEFRKLFGQLCNVEDFRRNIGELESSLSGST